MTVLPADFQSTFHDLQAKGILQESGDELRERIQLQLQAIRATERIDTNDLGPADWARDLFDNLQAAIHLELCDAAKKELKTEYAAHLTRAMTPESISAVTAIVLSVARTIHPAIAVSSLGIYIAAWLLKVGLNYWCSLPAPPTAE